MFHMIRASLAVAMLSMAANASAAGEDLGYGKKALRPLTASSVVMPVETKQMRFVQNGMKTGTKKPNRVPATKLGSKEPNATPCDCTNCSAEHCPRPESSYLVPVQRPTMTQTKKKRSGKAQTNEVAIETLKLQSEAIELNDGKGAGKAGKGATGANQTVTIGASQATASKRRRATDPKETITIHGSHGEASKHKGEIEIQSFGGAANSAPGWPSKIDPGLGPTRSGEAPSKSRSLRNR